MYFIDTHTHIYLPEFDQDRAAAVERAINARVDQLLLPAIDTSTYDAMIRTEAEYPVCKAMIGLHPCSVSTNFEEELSFITHKLQERRFVAIGEIGLDFYWDKTFTDQQYSAFERQIEIAMAQDLPIVIHSRNATAECIDVVRKYPGLRGVFHCFSGTADEAKAIVELGFLLGIGGVLTFKNSGLDKAIAGIELSSLVLETDAPYLAPVPYRGKRNEPAYIPIVAARMAEIFSCDVQKIQEITTENARKLFDLSAQDVHLHPS